MEKPKQYERYYKGQALRFYICDGLKCGHCLTSCKYTLDISHAKRPTTADGFTLSRLYVNG